jgi:hypothetical protein
MRSLFRFPNPVNEVSARLVAGGVVALCAVILAGRQPWLVAILAYGFVARVLTGPTLSPLGQLVTRVVTPRLPVAPRMVPGPPKRFAQGIGATLSLGAAVAHFGFGATPLAYALVAMIAVAASLEAFAGFCLGCKLFAALMRVGAIPAEACEACNDLSLRRALTS